MSRHHLNVSVGVQCCMKRPNGPGAYFTFFSSLLTNVLVFQTSDSEKQHDKDRLEGSTTKSTPLTGSWPQDLFLLLL